MKIAESPSSTPNIASANIACTFAKPSPAITPPATRVMSSGNGRPAPQIINAMNTAM